MNNIKSILLLAILGGIALFLGGFRIGRQVERVDKSYVPPVTITPTSVPTISPTPVSISFKAYAHPTCGISFLYPSELIETKISSDGATLSKNKDSIVFECTNKVASGEAILLTPTITTINNIDKWSVSRRNMRIIFNTSQNLTNLVIKTVSFVKR